VHLVGFIIRIEQCHRVIIIIIITVILFYEELNTLRTGDADLRF